MRQKYSWNEPVFPNCIIISRQIKIFKDTGNFFKTSKNFSKKLKILNENQVFPLLNFHFSLQTSWWTGNHVLQGPFQPPQTSVSFLLLYREWDSFSQFLGLSSHHRWPSLHLCCLSCLLEAVSEMRSILWNPSALSCGHGLTFSALKSCTIFSFLISQRCIQLF